MNILGTYHSSWDDGIEIELQAIVDAHTGEIQVIKPEKSSPLLKVKVLDSHHLVIDDIFFKIEGDEFASELLLSDVAFFRHAINNVINGV
jgi:hypothetical protein